MTTRPIDIRNDVNQTFRIPAALRPTCAQCLSPMTLETYFFSSQAVAQCTFTCYHKLTTRMKRRTFQFNKKGGVQLWK